MRFTNVPTLVKALSLMIRKTAFLTCLTAATLTFSMIGAACAALPAVVAVNREIGLSVTGNFQDVTHKSGQQSAYTDSYGDYGRRNDTARYHATGWTPGFRADAQYMFDTSILKHLYAAASFTLDDGTIEASGKYGSRTSGSDYAPRHRSGRYNFGANRSNINVTGEIGKGFLLLNDQLLITPTIQGGYRAGAEDSFTAYGKGYVGMALHIDYALTSRLVLRGRAGWAQYLEVHDYYHNQNFKQGSRSEWSGDIALDYRMTDRLHLTGGLRYTYLNYGRTRLNYDYNIYSFHNSVSNNDLSWRNGVQLRLGVAYQL